MPAAGGARYQEVAAGITDGHEVVASKMFGMPTLKVKSKAFAGLMGESMSFKLGAEEVARNAALAGAGSFDPGNMGRPMKDWLLVGPEGSGHWPQLAEKALTFVRSQQKG